MSDSPINRIEPSLAPAERLSYLTQNPSDTINVLTAHVANGGTITTLCETWGVSYSAILAWVYQDRTRERLYVRALNDRAEWAKEVLLAELRDIALVDIRKIFDDEGRIKPIPAWPKEIATALSSFEVVEEMEGTGRDAVQIGWLKKFKFFDKLKAVELLGKNLTLFIERHEFSGKITLEQLVAGVGGVDGEKEETA